MEPSKPAKLRGKMAVHDIPVFKLGALIDVHPTRLGRMLRGREPMPDAIYEHACAVLRSLPMPGPDEAA